MVTTAFHVLELLRQAEAYSLDVRGVFKRLGSSSEQAGDLPNSLRFFAWSLQRTFESKGADSQELMYQVRAVHSWIRRGVKVRQETCQLAKKQFSEKEADLRNMGYCTKELFGDSPMGAMMETGRRTVQLQQKMVNLWVAYDAVATQYCAGCHALSNPKRGLLAFVDIPYLPLYESEPFLAFMRRAADTTTKAISVVLSTAVGSKLTIFPYQGSATVCADGQEVQISGGLLECSRSQSFKELQSESFDKFSISLNGEKLPDTTLLIHKTPKKVSIVGALKGSTPVFRVVCKEDTREYGFCSTGRFTDMDFWPPRCLVKKV